MFRLLNNDANSYVFDWWNETYAKYLYPNAILQSQRISEFLTSNSTEECHRRFFQII
jgi:hypothetical protein